MRRARKHYLVQRTGDIRKDLTKTQLANIGAVAMAYNEAELMIDLLLVSILGLWPKVAAGVTSRINGSENKIDIAKEAMQQIGGNEEIRIMLASSLGKGGFALLKQYRDAVIHAHTLDAPSGIAGTSVKHGHFYEVLLTEKALDGLYKRLVLVRSEILEFCNIAISLSSFRRLTQITTQVAPYHPPAGAIWHRTKAKIERDIRAATSRCQSRQTRRLSLAPLPEFPSESELQEARQKWLKDRQDDQIGWYQSFPDPLAAPSFEPAVPTRTRPRGKK